MQQQQLDRNQKIPIPRLPSCSPSYLHVSCTAAGAAMRKIEKKERAAYAAQTLFKTIDPSNCKGAA